MSDDDNRLEKELAEVQGRFANHPYISIVSTEGTPVNKYVVEYRVNGLVRLDDGEIAKSDQHRIEISLSFGFPHFPPNCKPLTQIFHPDIDPSAIKIADFWTADESLVSLIIYIGQMICWQIYSQENVFNQEAESWFAANRDSVPLDSVDLAGGQGESAPRQKAVAGDLGLSAEDMPELAFDSLNLDFARKESVASPPPTSGEMQDIAKDIDFGFKTPALPKKKEKPAAIVVEEINIETASPLAEMPGDEVEGEVDLDFATVDVDYDILRGMMDQRNFFAAQRKLNSMAPENLSKSSIALRSEIENHIQDAEKIFKKAKQLEGQGLLEEAARKFEGVLNVARDYPALEENMRRVRNAWMATMGDDSAAVSEVRGSQEIALPAPPKKVEDYGEISLSLESDDKEDAAAGAGFSQPTFSDSLSMDQPMFPPPTSPGDSWPPPGAELKAKKAVTSPKAPAKAEKTKKSFLVVGCALLVGLALSGWIFLEWKAFNEAKEKWSTVHTLLEKGEYEQVSQRCTEITQLLDRVYIVMASGKKDILTQVQEIVGSEHFQEAMGGKVYFRNQYISQKAQEVYLEIEKFVADGEKKGSVSDWQGALVSYEAAFDLAEKNQTRLDQDFYNKVVFKVKQAQFANHVAQGKKAFISQAWLTAISHFEKAMELAQTRDVSDPTTSYDVNRYLQRAQFSQFLVDGDGFLKNGNWKEAVTKYQGAFDIAKNEDVIDKASRESVTLKLHQTTLMKGLSEGDKFTAAKKWAQAVAEYEKAESVLPYDVTIPGQNLAATQERLASSLLNAVYNREMEEARAYFVKKEYGKAISALNRSIRAIDSSPLKSKATWQLMKKQAEDDLKTASLQGVIEEKTDYLQEHYKDIFIENFVGVRVEALDQPQIKFLESSGSALVFRMRCRELRDLKYFTLELIYQYDTARNKWGFQGGE